NNVIDRSAFNDQEVRISFDANIGEIYQYGFFQLDNVALFGPQDFPAIAVEPTSQYVLVGDRASFEVVATGAKLTYQWLKGAGLLGAVGSSMSIASVSSTDAGEYSVVVKN